MNEDELRKSVRRQKFERQGLTLPTATTPTGTGSSSPSQNQVSFFYICDLYGRFELLVGLT